MGEREAAHEHGARGGRAIRVVGRVVREGRAAELARPRRHVGEPALARALHHDGLAERRHGEALAVGLFEAGEAVAAAPGRQNRGAHVELAGDRHRDRGDGRGGSATGPSVCDRSLHTAAQALLGRGVQPQAPAVPCDANAHGLTG